MTAAALHDVTRSPTPASTALAAGRRVLRIEAEALAALAEALDERFERCVEQLAADPRPGRGHRHGQERPRRAQDRRDLRLDRHAFTLRSSGRGQSWRSRHDHRGRRRAGPVQFRRDPGARRHRGPQPALRDPAAGDRRPRAPAAWPRPPIWCWCCRSGRRPARWAWRRPPRPPRCWRSAMRWRWRCSSAAASAPRTSACSIRAASSASKLVRVDQLMHARRRPAAGRARGAHGRGACSR